MITSAVTFCLPENFNAFALLFAPPAVASVPIRGSDEHFPIRRIFCVGRNYEAHAKEMGLEADREAPFYFTKAPAHYVPSMIHPVSAVIAHLSRFYHLQPGDLIFTGTPEGVGPVVACDCIEGMIEGVGKITLNIGAADLSQGRWELKWHMEAT